MNKCNKENLKKALADWSKDIGKDNVITDQESIARTYGISTVNVYRCISAVLIAPKIDHDQDKEPLKHIKNIIKTASRYKIPLYPISTGLNWGYGSANPTENDCAIVDMSGMTNIIDFVSELGTITVEPGVTQQMLYDFLELNEKKDSSNTFLTPVTGAGPSCSILGNALERGYGITPYTDHFGAVMAIEAVMPNENVYNSLLSEIGGQEINRLYKYSPGPYLDGLFTQGNFGIVTKMTLTLARRPEKIESFTFEVNNSKELESAVMAVREVLQSTSGITGSINLMNKERVLSMIIPYPHDKKGSDGKIDPSVFTKLAKKHKVAEWTGIGALYGNKKIVNSTKSVIKKILKPKVKKVIFVSHKLIRLIKRILDLFPFKHTENLRTRIDTLCEFFNIVEGHPSEVALPLAYWKSDIKPPDNNKNPAKDGCGLIWYAPLVPMKPERVSDFEEMVKCICGDYGIDPLITLTSLSERCFDSTIPILYDKTVEGAAKNAQACYDTLFKEGQKKGFVPYRMGVQSMHLITEKECTFADTVNKIKDALDPNNIIAPKRYSR